jgi:hypothetical protein
LKEWQFTVLFFVGVGGALILLLGPELGLNIDQNPGAITGIGAILTYVLTQRYHVTGKRDEKKSEGTRKEDVDNGTR